MDHTVTYASKSGCKYNLIYYQSSQKRQQGERPQASAKPNKLVWVPGYRVDSVLVTKATGQQVCLKVIRLPGAPCRRHKSHWIPILQHLSGDLSEWLNIYPGQRRAVFVRPPPVPRRTLQTCHVFIMNEPLMKRTGCAPMRFYWIKGLF